MRHAIALSLLLSGCAASHATTDLELGFTVASQRAQLAELAVQDLQDRVVELEAILKQQGLSRASGLQTVEQLAGELARLRGELEEARFDLDALRADFDQYQIDQERRVLHAEARLAQLERLLGVTPPPPPRLDAGVDSSSDGSASAVSSPPTSPPMGTPDDAPSDFESKLALAVARMGDGQQAAARVILKGALEDAPDHPRADEARYRLAETWYNEGKWRDAARLFQAVTDKHPKSTWAPWAMLRIGECFDGMGRADAAETFYDGVVRNFPGTDAAKEAAAKLAKR